MTYRNERPDAGRHANHDRLLIAAHAAGDLTGRELDAATRLVAECTDCRALVEELRVLRAGTHELPPAARPAGLDFRLTPAKAAELDRARGWRRLLRPFGTRSSSARPLAAAFTTLGLAGLLLAAMPGFLGGSFFLAGAGGATTEIRQESQGGTPAAAPGPDDADTGAPEGSPYVTSDGTGSTDYGAGSGKDTMGGEPTDAPGRLSNGENAPSARPTEATDELLAQRWRETGPTGPSPLVLLSAGFLGAGIGLLLLRLAARRLG